MRDNRTNARLALKVIDKTRVFRTSLTFQHVINERLVLEMCSGCPFLIQLRYAFQTDSHLYFATDFYDGGDVFSLLQTNRGRLNENHARRIIAEIVLALSWLHERNIVYRDLKPENVVLDGDGHVRLADFGLAKVLKSDHDYLTQTICGTTAYAAPEMLQSKPYNVSLDLWCLGIFIYHVLSGRTPFNFKGKTMEEMEEMQRNRQIRYSSSLSLEAVSLIKGLLQIDPFRRSTLEDVKRHPFFRGVDWVRVARKEPHPDDISRLVSDNDQRGSAVARLAVARAQQLGMDPDSTTQLTHADMQEVSSMTLDLYLLRNINPDEWRHVSFSDDDDMSATAEFPAVVHKKGAEMETWAIAGWAWTCSEASGYAAKLREGRNEEDLDARNRMNVTNGRRSLPTWNYQNYGDRQNQPAPGPEAARPFFGQRASLQEQPTSYFRPIPSFERNSRPIDKQHPRRIISNAPNGRTTPNAPNGRITPNLPNGRIAPLSPNGRMSPNAPNGRTQPNLPNGRTQPNLPNGRITPNLPNGRIAPNSPNGRLTPNVPNGTDPPMGRASISSPRKPLFNQRRSVDANANSPHSPRRNGGKGVLNFGRIGGSANREGKGRTSLDTLSRARRSLERWSRDGRIRRHGEGVVPRPIDGRHIKSSLDMLPVRPEDRQKMEGAG